MTKPLMVIEMSGPYVAENAQRVGALAKEKLPEYNWLVTDETMRIYCPTADAEIKRLTEKELVKL